MSIGCSSSCCTAPFHRYTERHGARMFTHAARFFSTTMSASRSAAARSGRLVNTNSMLMGEPFPYRRIAQPYAQPFLHSPVVEASRFIHEAQHLWRDVLGDAIARHARRFGQAGVL